MSRPFTKRGHDAITAEINRWWNEVRPMVLQEVHDAALQGDRSENAAYIYGKQRMRLIDKRLRVLRKKIDGVTVVDTDTLPQSNVVQFGALVTIESEDGDVLQMRLVDKEESDPDKMWVSVQSPMGRALIGSSVEDDVTVKLPKGTITYEVLRIYYGPDPLSEDEQ